MEKDAVPPAILAEDIPTRTQVSFYPQPFASRMGGREKRVLGDYFGLKNFGINLTRLAPKAVSALRHAHSRQDEFIYVIQGCPTLQSNAGKQRLSPGMCAGMPAGTGNACNLINETDEAVLYLEIGDRTQGDEVDYPDDDIKALFEGGQVVFTHKDGTPY
ncbi:MAG: cupin domain-containing protein [Candidatus Thiodiazotropha sp.]